MFRMVLTLWIGSSLLQAALAADWPTYRADAARSGYTAQTVPAELSLKWIYHSVHAPVPAWPRDPRMAFDWAYQVAIADGTLYYGSSADGKLYALDAATGEEQWTFYTEGPIRFAPVVRNARVFVASDDGHLYCLHAEDGSLVRKWRGGPRDERVLGNGRMISRWPSRGGAVIYDNVLYYAAGIWQSEGIYLYAIEPDSGEILWTNDSSGGIEMPQPHGGANAVSGVSAQGYLLADDSSLFVTTGRAVPAVFKRSTGEFSFYHLQKNTRRGGTAATVAGPFLYNGGSAFERESGVLQAGAVRGPVALLGEGVVNGSAHSVRALKWIQKETQDRKGNSVSYPEHEELWKVEKVAGGTSLIVAGDTIVSAGGRTVNSLSVKSQQMVWSTEVDDDAYGLAAADGRLYVSTKAGTIYCFDAEPRAAPGAADPVSHVSQVSPYGENDLYAAAAAEIASQSGITQGYCVDLGCGDGALAYELARQTDLHVVAIDSDPSNVEAARRKLDAAGLYGVRVTVHLGDPAKTAFPKYFANLVVSGQSVTEGAAVVDSEESFRLQRPYGGIRCLGKTGDLQVSRRGALANAGTWTHLYSDAANTLCSTDEVKGPLSVLWFRDVDLDLPQRHGRGPSPLFHAGRIFAEGLDALRAVDAYNGRTLWEFELKGALDAYNDDHLMGTSGTGGNFCVAEESLYVRYHNRCIRLDAATGKNLGEYIAPTVKDDEPVTWGYIACEDGKLFGSVVNADHVVRHTYKRSDDRMRRQQTESVLFFAMEAKTGRLLWHYDAKESIRHNAIAIGDGRVFLIDRQLALNDLLSRAPARRGEKPKAEPVPHEPGTLVVLDADTGKTVWTSGEDIFGTTLAFSKSYDMLLMCYQATRFRLPSEVGGRMAVLRASDGYRVWDKQVEHHTRPIVNERTIYAHGGAWDLLTGENQPFDFQKSYGCGQISSSKHLMLFRSATLGYFDLTRDVGTENWGGIRPGCWINALPAGGLVLVPDASAGCRCSYQNRSWVALQGTD
jgi:outer membrane protein assembly factor BamB